MSDTTQPLGASDGPAKFARYKSVRKPPMTRQSPTTTSTARPQTARERTPSTTNPSTTKLPERARAISHSNGRSPVSNETKTQNARQVRPQQQKPPAPDASDDDIPLGLLQQRQKPSQSTRVRSHTTNAHPSRKESPSDASTPSPDQNRQASRQPANDTSNLAFSSNAQREAFAKLTGERLSSDTSPVQVRTHRRQERDAQPKLPTLDKGAIRMRSASNAVRPQAQPTPTQTVKAAINAQQSSNAAALSHCPRRSTSSAAAKPAIATSEPQTTYDAPISAVNSGARTVSVRYERGVRPVQITPQTTPDDVLADVACAWKRAISPADSMVVESFSQLGLERPLRRYERIREVMNSWNSDDANHLLIEPRSAEAAALERSPEAIPKKAPKELTVTMYHSQKPGHWDKRRLTIRVDGQVLAAKVNGSDARNICHMSDFDIYFATPHQLKKLRPPKRQCFAVKSQQKSAMFLSTENFVHFFATKDREVARLWYEALFAWRSWYLVHEMGLGGIVQDESTICSPVQTTLPSRRVSVKRPTTARSARSREGPPVSYPASMMKSQEAAAAPQAFNPSGLLARSNSQRGRAVSTSRNPVEPTALTTQGLPGIKPLVDLTPTFQEAPQHLRKGHGVNLAQMPAGGLVDAATSPEDPLGIPSATTWRRAVAHERSSSRPRTSGGRPSGGRPSFDPPPRPGTSDASSPEVFTHGLIARAATSAGGRTHGRGIASGNRAATEPLLKGSSGTVHRSARAAPSVLR